jgi:transmembrane sensor
MSLPPPESSLAIAVRLWVKRHSGSWTRRDERRLQEWLAASPDHRAAFERASEAWEQACHIKTVARKAYPEPRAVRSYWPRLAAALVIALVAVPVWKRWGDWWNGTAVTWSAQPNSPRSISLPDGTRVDLDAGSSMVTEIGAGVRRITAIRGEALFTVKHDPGRSFVVEVGAGRLADLGTVFDVETSPQAVKVAVLSGSVDVTTRRGEVVLSAGQSGGFATTGELLPVIRADESVTLWREGLRRFDAVSLSEVLDRLSRRHEVQFTFADPRVRELRLSGTFRMDDLPLFLRTIGTALQLDVRWISPHHVQIGSKPRSIPDAQATGRTASGSN